MKTCSTLTQLEGQTPTLVPCPVQAMGSLALPGSLRLLKSWANRLFYMLEYDVAKIKISPSGLFLLLGRVSWLSLPAGSYPNPAAAPQIKTCAGGVPWLTPA